MAMKCCSIFFLKFIIEILDTFILDTLGYTLFKKYITVSKLGNYFRILAILGNRERLTTRSEKNSNKAKNGADLFYFYSKELIIVFH